MLLLNIKPLDMKTVIIGGNFAGFTAALELKRKAGPNVNITVIDRSPYFLFIPSLIWVPFRRRNIKDIQIRKDIIFKKKGIRFLEAEALKVDTINQTVITSEGDVSYDHLVIASGPKVNFDIAPGVKDHSYYIGTPLHAMKTRTKLDDFLHNPGPAVIAASQGAGCIGAAYEFLFNLEKWLREKGVRQKVALYWVTPEPYLGHFGIDGMPGGKTMLTGFMKHFNIHYRTSSAIQEVTADQVILSSGEAIDSKFTMVMPPFIGQDFIKNSPSLVSTAVGYIPVGDDYRHPNHPTIWAAGIAVDVKPPFEAGKIPFNAPKTGYPSEVTGKIVAENIRRVEKGTTKLVKKAWGRIPGVCIMDAGKKEVILLSDHLFKPRRFAIMIPNVFYDVFKVLFEKYFLWKTRRGLSYLP
jgi:sulfide:quinone oxidoreductase